MKTLGTGYAGSGEADSGVRSLQTFIAFRREKRNLQ